MNVVTLYGKPDCCLCDDARAAIVELCEAGRELDLKEVDITTDDELHRRMLERIPVVEVDGELISELTFDLASLVRRLDRVEA